MSRSLIPTTSVKVIAKTVGVERLDDDIAAALASDVEYRIREIAQEALKFMRHSKREVLTSEDVNNALQVRKVEALYGFASESTVKFSRAAGSNDMYYIEDKELDFNEVINAPLPKCTREATLTAHWLSVEGVQPAVPQNPTLRLTRDEYASTHASSPRLPVEVKPPVKHVLSQELQEYYQRVVMALESSGADEDELLKAAVKSLSTDPGINPLLPYLVQMVADKVTHNLRNLPLLKSLMRLTRALLENSSLHMEPYLHQVIPPILTCLLGRRLCSHPTDEHWSLRDFAASLLAFICERVGNTYQNLQPRITKTLLHALLDLTKPLTTHYGAIRGLCGLGARVIELLVLPNLRSYVALLEPETRSENPITRLEATKCYGALLEAAGIYLEQNFAQLDSGEEMVETAGVPRGRDPTEGEPMPVEFDHSTVAEVGSGVLTRYKLLREVFGEAIDMFLPTSHLETLL